MSDTKSGRYRHYKGGEYTVIGVAQHSESEELLVVYRLTNWWIHQRGQCSGLPILGRRIPKASNR